MCKVSLLGTFNNFKIHKAEDFFVVKLLHFYRHQTEPANWV